MLNTYLSSFAGLLFFANGSSSLTGANDLFLPSSSRSLLTLPTWLLDSSIKLFSSLHTLGSTISGFAEEEYNGILLPLADCDDVEDDVGPADSKFSVDFSNLLKFFWILNDTLGDDDIATFLAFVDEDKSSVIFLTKLVILLQAAENAGFKSKVEHGWHVIGNDADVAIEDGTTRCGLKSMSIIPEDSVNGKAKGDFRKFTNIFNLKNIVLKKTSEQNKIKT